MLLACLPFGPVVTSKETFWPSFNVLKPGMLIAEKCANRSSPPPSGVMNPNPLASLNHFTVPVGILLVPHEETNGCLVGGRGCHAARRVALREAGNRSPADACPEPNASVVRAGAGGRQAARDARGVPLKKLLQSSNIAPN